MPVPGALVGSKRPGVVRQLLAAVAGPLASILVVEAALLLTALVTRQADWAGVALLAIVFGSPLAFAAAWLVAIPLAIVTHAHRARTAAPAVTIGAIVGMTLPIASNLFTRSEGTGVIPAMSGLLLAAIVSAVAGGVGAWVWRRITAVSIH